MKIDIRSWIDGDGWKEIGGWIWVDEDLSMEMYVCRLMDADACRHMD